jgi:uncharacterized membrane protein
MSYDPQPSQQHRNASHGLGESPGMDGGSLPRRHWIGDSSIKLLARGIGGFSLGLGMTQLIAPRSVARMIGVKDDDLTRTLIRMVGMREVASGAGILATSRPTNWLRGRTGGDLMDLALLGAALRSSTTQRGKALGAAAAVLVITALDEFTSLRLSHAPQEGQSASVDERPGVRHSITVMQPVETVYTFWNDFRNFPRFMQNLESVEVSDDGRSHWVAKGPLGRTIAWDAEVVANVPNQSIAWRSIPGSTIENTGTVSFKAAPGGRGTEVHVDIRYRLPGGKVTATLAKLFAENPDREVYDDLRAFKQQMETGEVVLSESVLSGGRLHQRPAQPPETVDTAS